MALYSFYVALSVRNLDRSVAWYREVLGYIPIDGKRMSTWDAATLWHPQLCNYLKLQHHDENSGVTFDPRRTGLDSVCLLVKNKTDLELFSSRFDELSITHSPVYTYDEFPASVLNVRDPDEIQLSLSWIDEQYFASFVKERVSAMEEGAMPQWQQGLLPVGTNPHH